MNKKKQIIIGLGVALVVGTGAVPLSYAYYVDQLQVEAKGQIKLTKKVGVDIDKAVQFYGETIGPLQPTEETQEVEQVEPLTELD